MHRGRQQRVVNSAFLVRPVPLQAVTAEGRTGVNDEQLTISGVPSDGGRHGPRSPRPLRPRLVTPRDLEDDTPDIPSRTADGPDGAAGIRSARPRAAAVHDVDDLGVR